MHKCELHASAFRDDAQITYVNCESVFHLCMRAGRRAMQHVHDRDLIRGQTSSAALPPKQQRCFRLARMAIDHVDVQDLLALS